jgi:putative sterol carrier protein
VIASVAELVSDVSAAAADAPDTIPAGEITRAEAASEASVEPSASTNGKSDEPVTVSADPVETQPVPLAAPMFAPPSPNGSANGSAVVAQAVAEAVDQAPPSASAAVTETPTEAAPVVETQAPAPDTEAAVEAETGSPPTLFSEEWAQAYQTAINGNPAYKRASLRWDAGQLAFVIHAAPRHNLFAPTAVLLDLHRGDCRAAHNMPIEVAVSKAAFVIEGEYDNWIKVLNGEADPLKMLMRGGLKLRKGSMLRLIPFTQSAQELVKSAQRIS